MSKDEYKVTAKVTDKKGKVVVVDGVADEKGDFRPIDIKVRPEEGGRLKSILVRPFRRVVK